MTKKQSSSVKVMMTKWIFLLLIICVNDVYAINVCKDENGRKYFTDLGCPEGTANQDKIDINEANTYRARDSINIDLVNDYENRYKTGRSWRWVKKQQPE